jgi:hypothetical protein
MYPKNTTLIAINLIWLLHSFNCLWNCEGLSPAACWALSLPLGIVKKAQSHQGPDRDQHTRNKYSHNAIRMTPIHNAWISSLIRPSHSDWGLLPYFVPARYGLRALE